jgi:hypothetical protein
MRLIVSEHIRKCAKFFDRRALLDSACELIPDDIAAVRNDAVRFLAELMDETDIAIVQEFAESVNHWTGLCAARICRTVAIPVAAKARDIILRLMHDRVLAVRVEAEAAFDRISNEL